MADDQKGQNAEEQAQQPAMPTGDEKVQEVADSQESAPIQSEENLEAPAGDSDNLGLPKEASERTKEQFDKLQQQLRDARRDAFNARQEPSVESPDALYDKNTGIVNVDALEALQKQAYDADKRSRQLEERLVQQSQEDQSRSLFEAYPELKNPKTKEAKALFDESEKIWMHSQAYPEKYGGMSLTQKQSADLAKKALGTKAPTSKEDAQAVEAKEQASLSGSGRPTQGVKGKVQSEQELQRLALGTRVGDKDSMIARMKAIREAK